VLTGGSHNSALLCLWANCSTSFEDRGPLRPCRWRRYCLLKHPEPLNDTSYPRKKWNVLNCVYTHRMVVKGYWLNLRSMEQLTEVKLSDFYVSFFIYNMSWSFVSLRVAVTSGHFPISIISTSTLSDPLWTDLMYDFGNNTWNRNNTWNLYVLKLWSALGMCKVCNSADSGLSA